MKKKLVRIIEKNCCKTLGKKQCMNYVNAYKWSSYAFTKSSSYKKKTVLERFFVIKIIVCWYLFASGQVAVVAVFYKFFIIFLIFRYTSSSKVVGSELKKQREKLGVCDSRYQYFVFFFVCFEIISFEKISSYTIRQN